MGVQKFSAKVGFLWGIINDGGSKNNKMLSNYQICFLKREFSENYSP